MASSLVRSTLRFAYCTTAPGPGSRLMRVSPSSRYRPPDAAICLATMKRAPAVPKNVSFTSVLAPPHPVGRSVLARSATTGWGRSSLCNLRQRHLHLLPEVAVVKLLDPLERVDLPDRLVVADANDAWESKREAACMSVRPLYRVERDFQHDLRFDRVPVAHVANLHAQELLGHRRDLGVGQPCVRLADIDELARLDVQHGEGVVGKHALALAVAPFDRGHDHVQRGERPLQLQPREAATSRRVWAVRVLDHQALVPALARLRKDAVEVVGARRLLHARKQEWMLDLERLEQAPPLLQRLIEHRATVYPEQIEDDQRD